MEIYEITINDEVFVSMDTDYEGTIDTVILENNLYGKNKFLRKEFFHRFTEDGPEKITRIEMSKILIHSEDN